MEFIKETHFLKKVTALSQYVKKSSVPIGGWLMKEANYTGMGTYKFLSGEWKNFEIGDSWGANDDLSAFFKTSVTVPEDFAGEKVVLDLCTGGESLVYLDGKIKNGLSLSQRNRVLISACAKGGESFELMIEAGAHCADYSSKRLKTPVETYVFTRAEVYAVDEFVESYYFDMMLAVEALCAFEGNYFRFNGRFMRDLPREYYALIKSMQSDDLMHDKLRYALDMSFRLLDLESGRERLHETIVESKVIYNRLFADMKYASPVSLSLVGASHIDVAWLWTLKETVRKCARTFSNTLELMDEYPEHIYAQSQPQLYDYTKKYYPELFGRICDRVKDGRWELVGNAWVECDTNIPSGESLVRQFLYGRNFYLEEFGKESNIFWMPDVFGYSWAIPQIMKRSGVDYFITTKLICNDTNTFPYTFFEWQGVDGTRVFAHLSRENYNGIPNPWYAHYLWDHNTQKDAFNDVILTYGYGDGGGGPTQEMLEYARRMNDFPGICNVEYKPAKQFFDEAFAVETELPVWNDEIYFENHRGTYTTQANNKKNNRRSEFLFRDAEILSSLACGIFGEKYEKAPLDEGWMLILLNQFHDILPGSSINLFYKDCEADYKKIFATGNCVKNTALQNIASRIKTRTGVTSIAVFNLLGWQRTDFIQINIAMAPGAAERMTLKDSAGTPVNFDVSPSADGSHISFTAKNLPSFGYSVFTLEKAEKTVSETRLTATASLMENRFFRVTLDQKGEISGLFDKIRSIEVLPVEQTGNKLIVFEDNTDAWNIELGYMDKAYEPEFVSAEVIEVTPDRGVLRIKKSFNKSSFSQDIIIYGDIPRIDFKTTAEWYEKSKLLKASFPVDVFSDRASYEIAYGAISRPTHWNTNWDKAKFEVPAHKWADLSDNGFGVSLLN
ncbi:MAG: glycoside hydrolase family 38 C-terminal domain-containing protein, partial [Eubacteriales bacterium]